MGTGENNPDRVFLPPTSRNPDDLTQQPDPAKRQQPATPQPQIRPPPTSLKYRLCPHSLGRLGQGVSDKACLSEKFTFFAIVILVYLYRHVLENMFKVSSDTKFIAGGRGCGDARLAFSAVGPCKCCDFQQC